MAGGGGQPTRPGVGPALAGGLAVLVAAVAVAGVATAQHHAHGGAHASQHAHVAHHAARGTDGVTAAERARADRLVRLTRRRLPRFADVAVAQARGYRSIGDAPTGYEHFIKWSAIDDDRLLDPRHPESLVYRVSATGRRTLVAAMFMLRERDTLDTVPDVGGRLTQWHIHDDLCFTRDRSAPRVAGITTPGGPCPAPLVKRAAVPMLHVWIVPHKCGPFAALEGIAAGQIKAGEQRRCDRSHGGH